MSNRVLWNADYACGNALLDAQHQNLLDLCNHLADSLTEHGGVNEPAFDAVFQQLMAQAAEHFAAEEALLIQCNYPQLDEHHHECDEFGYLSHDIVTAENFERSELQRFLSLWWIGHIVGSGKKYRPFFTASGQSPAPQSA